jgi:[protein-PII] uridylyltransferase
MSAAAPTPPDASASTSRDADAAWAQEQREALALGDAGLAGQFDRGVDSERLTALRAHAVDAIVVAAWRRCLPADADAALFAVGGYGRGELFPHSDIDLLVLAAPVAQQRHQEALARFIALLWDAGLAASHAVRSPEQCTEVAADLTVRGHRSGCRSGVARGVARLSRVRPPRRRSRARRRSRR